MRSLGRPRSLAALGGTGAGPCHSRSVATNGAAGGAAGTGAAEGTSSIAGSRESTGAGAGAGGGAGSGSVERGVSSRSLLEHASECARRIHAAVRTKASVPRLAGGRRHRLVRSLDGLRGVCNALVVPAVLLAFVALGACEATIPEDRFACTTRDECPPGWFCVAGHCRSTADRDAGLDASVRDAGERDGGDFDAGDRDAAAGDSGGDAGRPCASTAECDDGNPCTDQVCDRVCVITPRTDGADCSNDVFCDGAETCASGVCTAGEPPCVRAFDCDEPNDWCRCDDGNPCTTLDHLHLGSCVGDNADDETELCGACGATGCEVCCSGACTAVTTHLQCGHCGVPCPLADICVFSSSKSCGSLYCCQST
jgi:hypothetical protein